VQTITSARSWHQRLCHAAEDSLGSLLSIIFYFIIIIIIYLFIIIIFYLGVASAQAATIQSAGELGEHTLDSVVEAGGARSHQGHGSP